MLVLVRLSLLLGMLWLGELEELLGGMPLLAVWGWLWLRLEEELLELDCDCDCDCDDELGEDCDCEGCAGGCCCVCWVLQPLMTALSTMAEARVRQPRACCSEFRTAIRRVIVLS
ncbi:hypothetical protein AWR36_012555 [Microbulbifer flavimaris]|uniref:Secreted protein n=2 Tax=Microbulbiferaceae TaxID=1706373 RepID=A0ABX4HXG6_9GAMM|nr:hypothetical protein AVO43_12520 [Microbulbifer sp. ZGT114]PCO04820.1 hypothetical protein AWR36_012555 [Microbulbifer flavimaris]